MSASSSRHAPPLPVPTPPPVQVQQGLKRRRPRNTPYVYQARDTNIVDQAAISAFFFSSLSLSPSQRPSFLPMNLLHDLGCRHASSPCPTSFCPIGIHVGPPQTKLPPGVNWSRRMTLFLAFLTRQPLLRRMNGQRLSVRRSIYIFPEVLQFNVWHS